MATIRIRQNVGPRKNPFPNPQFKYEQINISAGSMINLMIRKMSIKYTYFTQILFVV